MPTLPTTTPLGASTLVRKWKLDVNTGTSAAPVWTRVMGIGDFKPNLSLTMQDDSDFDSGGDKSSTATAREWGCEFKVARKVLSTDATAYDVGQEKLRLAAAQLGAANTVEIRFYEYIDAAGGPQVEAYQGKCAVDWSPDGGNMEALETVSVKLMGQGKRTPITHPAV